MLHHLKGRNRRLAGLHRNVSEQPHESDCAEGDRRGCSNDAGAAERGAPDHKVRGGRIGPALGQERASAALHRTTRLSRSGLCSGTRTEVDRESAARRPVANNGRAAPMVIDAPRRAPRVLRRAVVDPKTLRLHEYDHPHSTHRRARARRPTPSRERARGLIALLAQLDGRDWSRLTMCPRWRATPCARSSSGHSSCAVGSRRSLSPRPEAKA